MTAALFVAVAAVATLARALLSAAPAAGQIPWRTLGVNYVGALALGLWIGGGWLLSYDTVIAVAGLGSLTTFSTVAGETASLADDGHKRTAVAYVVLTLVVGIAGARLGLEIGDRL